MNYDRLRECARDLEKVAANYAARDPEAARFYDAVKPWLAKAEAGQISKPVEARELPSRVFFDEEGTLRKYPELESAFSKFAVEAMDQTSHLSAVERILAKVRSQTGQK